MHRFYLPENTVTPNLIYTLPEEESRHCVKVLRLRSGDTVSVFDGRGSEFRAQIDHAAQAIASVRILEKIAPPAEEISTRIILALPLTDQHKLEFICEKGAEMGVHRFSLFHSTRSLTHKPTETLSSNNKARLHKKCVAAAKQCGRALVPEICDPESLTALFTGYGEAHDTLRILPWEKCTHPHLSSLLHDNPPRTYGAVALVTGPEGGFSEDEVAHAKSAGFLSCSLGTRILRLESAALASLSLILGALGQM